MAFPDFVTRLDELGNNPTSKKAWANLITEMQTVSNESRTDITELLSQDAKEKFMKIVNELHTTHPDMFGEGSFFSNEETGHSLIEEVFLAGQTDKINQYIKWAELPDDTPDEKNQKGSRKSFFSLFFKAKKVPAHQETIQPPEHEDTTQPPEHEDTAQPPENKDTAQPPENEDTAQPPENEDTAQPPENEDTAHVDEQELVAKEEKITAAIAEIQTLMSLQEVADYKTDVTDPRIDQTKKERMTYLEENIQEIITYIQTMDLKSIKKATFTIQDPRIDQATQKRIDELLDQKKYANIQKILEVALKKQEFLLYKEVKEKYLKYVSPFNKITKQEKNNLKRYLTTLETQDIIRMPKKARAFRGFKDQKIIKGPKHSDYITEVAFTAEDKKTIIDAMKQALQTQGSITPTELREMVQQKRLTDKKERIQGKPKDHLKLVKGIFDEQEKAEYIVAYGGSYIPGINFLASTPHANNTKHASSFLVQDIDAIEKEWGMIAWYETGKMLSDRATQDATLSPLLEQHNKTTLTSWNPYEMIDMCKEHNQPIPLSLKRWAEKVQKRFLTHIFANKDLPEAILDYASSITKKHASNSIADQKIRTYLAQTYAGGKLPTGVQQDSTQAFLKLFAGSYTTRKLHDLERIIQDHIDKDIADHLKDVGVYVKTTTETIQNYKLLDNLYHDVIQEHDKEKGIRAYQDVYDQFTKATHGKHADIAKTHKQQFEVTPFEKKNPYLLLKQLQEIQMPIPATLWDWIKLLEKKFITVAREKIVLPHHDDLATQLTHTYNTGTIQDAIRRKYITTHYAGKKFPKTYESRLKTTFLAHFKNYLSEGNTELPDLQQLSFQEAKHDLIAGTIQHGLTLLEQETTLHEGNLHQKNRPLDPKAQFAQALHLQDLAHCQAEYLEEKEAVSLQVTSAQKKPQEYVLTHGKGWKKMLSKCKKMLIEFFANDTSLAREKKSVASLSKKYLKGCPKTPYKRTCPDNWGEVIVDGSAGTITHKHAGYNPITVGINREKPEETMQQLASSSAFGGEPISGYVLQALIQAYAEKLIDNDGPQKFTNVLGETCILRMGRGGSVEIERNGEKMSPINKEATTEKYTHLLEYRSHIKSAIQQYVPLDERLDTKIEGEIAGVDIESPIRQAYKSQEHIHARGFTPRWSEDIIASKAYPKEEKLADGTTRTTTVPATYRKARTISIESDKTLSSYNTPGAHVFTGKEGFFSWGGNQFIKLPNKVLQVKHLDEKNNTSSGSMIRYEIIAEYASMQELSDAIDIDDYFEQVATHLTASDTHNQQIIQHMEPLVSFIIPVDNDGDTAQVFYFDPRTRERFKGQDQDGHPGVSATDLGDFADDIQTGKHEKRGKNLSVAVKAFATKNKGMLSGDTFSWTSTGKDISSLQKVRLSADQLPQVLQSTQAKKATYDALARLLSSLG